MSALPPKADIERHDWYVRFVPKADSCTAAKQASSLDYLVGAGEQRVRDGEAERPGRRHVDHQIVLGRCLHRQVARLLALEDTVDVAGRAPILVDRVRGIGDQTTAGDEQAVRVDRRQAVP